MPLAALLMEPNKPLELAEVELPPPGPGEVTVRLVASGVCHTDATLATSSRPLPMPLILGHEAAGVVTAVGDGVTSVRPDDHVVLSAIPQCGHCFYCRRGQPTLCELFTGTRFGHQPDGTTRVRLHDEPVYQFGSCGTFTEETLVPAVSAVRIPEDVPLELAALLGCAVISGYGAAVHTASIREDDVVVVLGVGGVGLNVVQGARLAGARTIVAIDRDAGKLELSKRFGATHVVLAADNPRMLVDELTDGRGGDVVFEVVGTTTSIVQAIRLARRGGHVVMVGAPDAGSEVPFAFGDELLRQARTLTGCFYGSADVHRDIPALVEHYRRGDLLLDELVSRRVRLDEVNSVLADLGSATSVRAVICY
jgi:Zn-dependent alcohol dehydrogenase